MTQIGVAIGLVCLALASSLSAKAQTGEEVIAKQEANPKQNSSAKQDAPEGSRTKQQDTNGKQNAGKEVKEEKKVNVNVVFAGNTKFVDGVKASCRETHPDKLQECLAGEMKKAGATPAAVEFSKALGEPGFVRDFRVAGPVDIAYVLYPYRANENQSWLIVNGMPSTVDVDSSKMVTATTRTLKNNAVYAGLAKGHPDISPWPGDRYSTETPDVEMGANGGVHIIVNYRLRERCHSCAVLGHAWYSFEFDAHGIFAGARLMAVSVVRDKAPEVRPRAESATSKSRMGKSESAKNVTSPGAATPTAVATSVGEEFTIALPVKEAGPSEWSLARGLDTVKVRLIEHSLVAPPAGNGAVGNQELWKFAALGAGTTEIALQRDGEKPVTFRVVIRAHGTGRPARAPAAKR